MHAHALCLVLMSVYPDPPCIHVSSDCANHVIPSISRQIRPDRVFLPDSDYPQQVRLFHLLRSYNLAVFISWVLQSAKTTLALQDPHPSLAVLLFHERKEHRRSVDLLSVNNIFPCVPFLPERLAPTEIYRSVYLVAHGRVLALCVRRRLSAVVQKKTHMLFVWILIKVINTIGIKYRRTTFDTMHFIILVQQKLSQIGAILAGHPGNQCFFIRKHLASFYIYLQRVISNSST